MIKIYKFLKQSNRVIHVWSRSYHNIPFVELYQEVTGELVSQDYILRLLKKSPSIERLSHDHLTCTLDILKKFDITPYDAFKNHHVFCMNPITMDNYGEILKECGFVQILPQHITKYHTLVRKTTIKQLKGKGLLPSDLNLEQQIIKSIKDWSKSQVNASNDIDEAKTSILKVRMLILEAYLTWVINITSEDFQKYCRLYLPLQHKPMADIQESLHLAQNVIHIDKGAIRRNGFLIAVDPVNTKLILENVPTLAGLSIHEALRTVPAILKNNYNSLLKISKILEEYEIREESQRKTLRVFCMKPETVQSRLEELRETKEFQVFSTNPRVLNLVVHKQKFVERVDKIQSANAQAFRLTHLISSSQAFNKYINSIGRRVWGNDVVLLIYNSLFLSSEVTNSQKTETMTRIKLQLKRHKYWTHAAMDVVDDNLKYLKRHFAENDIVENCQLLLYPSCKVQEHVEGILEKSRYDQNDVSANINYTQITKTQVLSLVLYEIERKHHFTGDGMWVKDDHRQEFMIAS